MVFIKTDVQRQAARLDPIFPYRINVLSPKWLKVIDLPGNGVADIQAVDGMGLSVNLICKDHAFHRVDFDDLGDALEWIREGLDWLADTTIADPVEFRP